MASVSFLYKISIIRLKGRVNDLIPIKGLEQCLTCGEGCFSFLKERRPARWWGGTGLRVEGNSGCIVKQEEVYAMLRDLAVQGEVLGEGRGSSGREEGEGQSAEPSSPARVVWT